MTINLTVVVQLVHFMIAYFILERVLFRPSVSALREHDALFHEKLDRVAKNKKEVEKLRFKIEEERKAYQEELQKHIPPLVSVRQSASMDDIYKDAQLQEKEQDVQASAEVIVEKVVKRIAHG